MAVKTIPNRDEINNDDKWDLSPLFKNDDQWKNLFSEVEAQISEYNQYKNRLHESAQILKDAIELDLTISRKLEKLYTFAHLKSDEDKSNQHYLSFYQLAINLYTRISEASSYIAPEIQGIDDDTMTNLLHDNILSDYKYFLQKLLRYKPHTLSKEIEKILAMAGEITSAPSQIFSQLDNADLQFGIIQDEKGNDIELSHGNFSVFLINKNRDIRKNAFKQYYKSYDDHKNTIATTYTHSVKKDSFYSRVRNHESSRSGSLFSDDVPESVYDNLINTVKKNINPLFDYLNFRKEALNLKDLHFYDTYVPIVEDVDIIIPYDEAVETSINSLQILGKEYTDILEKGLSHGWVDKYENKGKRSGAYSSGCYDSPPYILMNYKEDTINSLFTLIHEAGHSMHSYYSKKNQPYIYSDYTIFVAEVASTVNETLLTQYLLEKHKDDKKMRTYLLNREIDNIRATLIRQTMFAEFEKLTHEIIEKNEALTLDQLREIYRGLLKEYFGDGMVIDDELTLECLRIPHFYSPFYVYKYATGLSAAIAITNRIKEEGDSARDNYINFLKLGGSKFPLEQLLQAGVDMKNPKPIENALLHFKNLVDQLLSSYKEL